MDAPSETRCCAAKDLVANGTRPNTTQQGFPLHNEGYVGQSLLAINSNNRVSEIVLRVRYWSGISLMLITLAFITYKIYVNWTAINLIISQIKVSAALGGMGILSTAVTLLGWNWISILHYRGIHARRLNCIRVYFLANLTRYIPGGVWHFAGRTLWLLSQGYRPQSVVESLIFEQGLTLTAAIAVGFLSLTIVERSPLLIVGITFFSVFLLVLLAAFAVTDPKTVRKGLNSQSIEGGLILVVRYVLFWILYGLATSCFAAAILEGERLTFLDFTRLIGQAALSWAIGYTIFVVPGGWGIRELAFMHLLSRDFSGSIVFVLPVLSRLAQILAEILCGGAFSLMWWLNLWVRRPKVS